ncbi:hypothetical protein Tco_0033944 [Tanacetum coccineum]
MFFYLTTLNLARFLKETAPLVEPPREGQPSNAWAVLLHDIYAKGMTLSETFQVATIIEKLPLSWDNKLAQKNTYTPDSDKANMVEHVRSSSKSNSKGKGKDKRKNDKKGKGEAEYLAPKANINCKALLQHQVVEICFNSCGELFDNLVSLGLNDNWWS